MPERFRLKYFSSGTLAIRWADPAPVAGDCYVLACREASDTASVDRHAAGWSHPMTADVARAFIASHPKMLGSLIHDCQGLALLDGDRGVIDFDPPIQVRDPSR